MTFDQLPEPCADFDFLIGRWDAVIRTGAGTLNGRWEACYLHDGRMVMDHLVVRNGLDTVRTMATLRTWVPAQGSWAIIFLYSLEPPQFIELRGERVHDELHLRAKNLDTEQRADVRFFEITPSSFRWEQVPVNVDGRGATEIAIRCTRVSEPMPAREPRQR